MRISTFGLYVGNSVGNNGRIPEYIFGVIACIAREQFRQIGGRIGRSASLIRQSLWRQPGARKPSHAAASRSRTYRAGGAA